MKWAIIFTVTTVILRIDNFTRSTSWKNWHSTEQWYAAKNSYWKEQLMLYQVPYSTTRYVIIKHVIIKYTVKNNYGKE